MMRPRPRLKMATEAVLVSYCRCTYTCSNEVMLTFLGRLLKSSIFVVQKAAAPKNGEEFRQRSIGTIRISLATSYNVWQHREVFGLPIHLLTPHSQSRVWRQGRCLKIMENLSHADPTHQP